MGTEGYVFKWTFLFDLIWSIYKKIKSINSTQLG